MSRAKSEGLEDDKIWINCIHVSVRDELPVVTTRTCTADISQLLLGTPEAMPSSIVSTVYHLLTTPSAYAAAVDEIRQTFKSSSDITVEACQHLPFLLACFKETLRRRPTILGTLSRQVPPAGGEICGKYVAGGTIVGVNNHATSRSAKNFWDPDSFRPERWLEAGKEEFENDIRDAFNPFGYGPRKCIARK